MSKAPRRKKPAADQALIAATFLSDRRRQILVAVALAVFAGIPFLLGKYFELKYPDPFDSGSYVYSAQHVLSGARIGYDEKPSAQAGTLLVNMLGVSLSGFNETGSKVLQGIFQAAAFAFLFVTIRRLYGSLAAVISVTVASVYLSAPLIAKFGNVKEQFMIALMIMGICSFVLYHLGGKWWWGLLTGGLLIGGPMFKQTGISAVAAVGLFTLAQPILHHCAWKKVGVDILLMIAGAAIVLTPICGWYASMGTPLHYWPYSFAFGPVFKLVGVDLEREAVNSQPQEPVAQEEQKVETSKDSLILRLLPGYVRDSWKLLGPEERTEAFRRVLRYYGLLILPIALALGAILSRVVVVLRGRGTKQMIQTDEDPGRFVLLFGLWWFFDMAFVWISPHSYEQYYLPLNASSAVLGSYLVGLYAYKLHADSGNARWVVLGLLGLLAMIVMSWHIFFGIAKSPHTGRSYMDYRTGSARRDRGYLQRWEEVAGNPQYDWMRVSDYIRANSEPNDPLYVWGWVPGIYVQAQRMSPTPKPFEGMMHALPPKELAERVREIVDAFEKNPPKFIVDTRKRHFPWTVPPLELWPNIANGIELLANQPEDRGQLMRALLQALDVQPDDLTKEGYLRSDRIEGERKYDAAYEKLLRERKGPAEAQRYEAMRPLQSYVMKNYQVVGSYGQQILFKRK
ncbi:MAG: glycosyltransferase family 39 protein [Phycisphaerales bacterium]